MVAKSQCREDVDEMIGMFMNIEWGGDGTACAIVKMEVKIIVGNRQP